MRALISSKIFCRSGARSGGQLVGVGVLRLEVGDDFGVGLVPQPLVGVDEHVAVVFAAVLDPFGVRWLHGSNPVVEPAARNAFVGFDIARAGGVDDVGGQRRRRFVAVAVPAGLRAGQPVADELLVEALLHDALLVVVGAPVARGVGGEDLVGQSQVAVLVDAELELGVGDDDALGQGVIGALDVGLQGAFAQLVGAARRRPTRSRRRR